MVLNPFNISVRGYHPDVYGSGHLMVLHDAKVLVYQFKILRVNQT